MRKILLFFVWLLASIVAQSQRTYLDEGNDYFDRRLYKEAIESYNRALKERLVINREMMLERIAQTYRMLFEYQNAETAYRRLFSESSSTTGTHHLEFADVLLNLEKHDEAIEQAEKGKSKQGNEIWANRIIESARWAKQNRQINSRVEITKTNIETGSRSIGTAFYDKGLLVANPQIKDFVNQTAFYNLAYVPAQQPAAFGVPLKLDGVKQNKFYEGSPSLSPDGKMLLFTSNSSEITKYRNKKLKKNKYAISADGVNILKIYTASLINGAWSNVREHPVSSNAYDCTFPHFAEDGKTMYFASNMPGGQGGYDIWRTTLQTDSSWSKPENLGAEINTPGDEMYPYVFEGTLYFSSKGRVGYGGADIYSAKVLSQGFGYVENLGLPYNTSKDDFAFIVRRVDDGREGYFSSNREGANGYDYVYYFRETLPQFQRFKFISSPISLIGMDVNDAKPEMETITKSTIGKDSTFSFPKHLSNGIYELELIDAEVSIAMKTCIAVLDDSGNIIGYAKYVDGTKFTANMTYLLVDCEDKKDSMIVAAPDTKPVKTEKAKPASFSKNFTYNEFNVSQEERDFQQFVHGISEIVTINGNVTIRIESSASQVPTTTHGNNQNLASKRGKDLEDRIKKALSNKGVDLKKVKFEAQKTQVQGPAFDGDHENTAKYGPFQYVKALAE